MKSHLLILSMAAAGLFLAPGFAWAQATQTPEQLLDEPLEPALEAPAEAQDEEAEAELVDSSETDFNEDNFRRSMELRDQTLQRSPDLTTGSYSRATGLQLEGLPEESQKHLRDELREVIVGKGPWTPEENGEIYPYQPSEGAEKNPGLEKRERDAWAELVGKYHEREAAIHANAARSQAATSSDLGEGSSEMGQQQQGGSAPEEGGSSDLEAASAAALQQAMSAGSSASSSASQASAEPLEQGVSQNALQLLTQRQQLPAASASASAPQAEQVSQQTAQSQSEDASNASTEQADLDFQTEGVIAIEDLRNLDLDYGSATPRETDDPEEN